MKRTWKLALGAMLAAGILPCSAWAQDKSAQSEQKEEVVIQSSENENGQENRKVIEKLEGTVTKDDESLIKQLDERLSKAGASPSSRKELMTQLRKALADKSDHKDAAKAYRFMLESADRGGKKEGPKALLSINGKSLRLNSDGTVEEVSGNKDKELLFADALGDKKLRGFNRDEMVANILKDLKEKGVPKEVVDNVTESLRKSLPAMTGPGMLQMPRLSKYMLGVDCKVEEVDGNPQVTVDSVLPESAANKAGIKEGDRIVKVGDKKVQEISDLVAAVQSAGEAGKSLTVVVMRNDEEKSFDIKPDESAKIFPDAKFDFNMPGGQLKFDLKDLKKLEEMSKNPRGYLLPPGALPDLSGNLDELRNWMPNNSKEMADIKSQMTELKKQMDELKSMLKDSLNARGKE